MSHVFVRIDYSILFIPDLFEALTKFIGYFQFTQTIEQSHNTTVDLWFYTDKVKLIEGETRQVEILVTKAIGGKGFDFSINPIHVAA